MPDYAILEDLTCELGITVNELIRGEKIIKEAAEIIFCNYYMDIDYK